MWFYTLRFCFLRSVTSANPGNFVEPLDTGPGCLKAWLCYTRQRAKKVVSDSPGLVDFSIGLVNSVLNLPDGQEKIFLRSKITEVL